MVFRVWNSSWKGAGKKKKKKKKKKRTLLARKQES
jgi:hypothetical protein